MTCEEAILPFKTCERSGQSFTKIVHGFSLYIHALRWFWRFVNVQAFMRERCLKKYGLRL